MYYFCTTWYIQVWSTNSSIGWNAILNNSILIFVCCTIMYDFHNKLINCEHYWSLVGSIHGSGRVVPGRIIDCHYDCRFSATYSLYTACFTFRISIVCPIVQSIYFIDCTNSKRRSFICVTLWMSYRCKIWQSHSTQLIGTQWLDQF